MADQVLPNTDTTAITTMAIAWEIVRNSKLKFSIEANSAEEYLAEVTNAYLKAYNAIIKNEPIKTSP